MSDQSVTRRKFLKTAGLGGLALSVPTLTNNEPTKQDKPIRQSKNKATDKRPNIVYIHSHDTGRYIQPYGYAIPTPNIQKLADEGVLFRQTYTTHPTSSPSRGSLLTGMHPHTNGLIGLAHRGFKLNDYKQHIIHTLKKYGYHTGLAGVQHVVDHKKGHPHEQIGYDEWVAGTHSFDEMNKVVDWIDDAPEKPFFLSVGFGETHRKFHPTNWKDKTGNMMPAEPLPDTPETRQDWSEYKETARILDEKMGMVFDALARNGLDKNTLVICTTDHGIAFPRMKCNLTDGGIAVMLIMRGPKGFTGGKVIDSLISNIDIFPTICDILEVDKPDWLQGQSMLPLIDGKKDEINEAVFAQVNYHAAYDPQRCIRTKRWKYICRYDKRHKPNLPNCDDSISKALWLEKGWQSQPIEEEELYDLIFDPNERNNLAKDPTKQSVLKDMQQALEKQMKATNDPMLQGYIAAPADAILNDPDGLSPKDKKKVKPPYIQD